MNKLTRPAALTLITAAAVLVPVAGYSLAQNFQTSTAPEAAVQATPTRSSDPPSERPGDSASAQMLPWSDEDSGWNRTQHDGRRGDDEFGDD